MEKDCSPAALEGYACQEGKSFQTKVSTPTIYRYIRKGVFLCLSMRDLPRRGEQKIKYQHMKKEKEPGRAPVGESIEQRPEEVETREVLGHWEMDTVYSAKTPAGRSLFIKLRDRAAATVVKAIDGLEEKWGAVNFRQIFAASR